MLRLTCGCVANGRIFTADDTDVSAMKGLSSDSKLKGWILRLRGLPFNATDEDVVRLL